MNEYRLVSAINQVEDVENDYTLRPRFLYDFIGQEKIKEGINIFIQAARMRGDPLDHVLLFGPPGLGKTTLANIIANEMGVNIRVTSGPAIERPGDLAAILTSLNEKDILFIDEVHRLTRTVEEILYPAMEDYALDIVIGKGPGARSLRLDLPRFTLIGATTRAGMLTSPLRDRFGVISRLNYYQPSDLVLILVRAARILGTELTEEGSQEIAKRSRGTPRVANRLLRRVRDYAQVRAGGVINAEVAKNALEFMEIDVLGLDQTDRSLLLSIIEKFKGGPVGLDTLATAASEEPETVEDVFEPYLIQLGLLARTPRGRVATSLAYHHLGLKPVNENKPDQETIW